MAQSNNLDNNNQLYSPYNNETNNSINNDYFNKDNPFNETFSGSSTTTSGVPTAPPPPPTPVPIDGGTGFLLVAGAAYGLKKLKKKSKGNKE